MYDLSRLLRFPNLLVVALTQALVYYRVVRPALGEAGLSTTLSPAQFWVLVLTTMMITAGGYVINDLLDIKSDIINRPGTNMVYRFGEDRVRWIYLSLVLGGFALSLVLALLLGERSLIGLYPLAVGLLALYSRYVKPLPLAGNLLVALYCAGVPGLVALAERSSIRQLQQLLPATGNGLVRILTIYCLFAFVATLLREVVKDMQDLRGDREIGRRTLPVRWGIESSRRFGLLLAALTLAALTTPILLGWSDFLTPASLTFIALLVVSLGWLSVRLVRSRQPAEFGWVSRGLKLFLLGGLGLLFLL